MTPAPSSPIKKNELEELFSKHAYYGHGGEGAYRCTSFGAQELDMLAKDILTLLSKSRSDLLREVLNELPKGIVLSRPVTAIGDHELMLVNNSYYSALDQVTTLLNQKLERTALSKLEEGYDLRKEYTAGVSGKMGATASHNIPTQPVQKRGKQ